MAAFFTAGERKVRPGVYLRYENYGTPLIAGASDGVCAAVIRSNWGKIGETVLLENTGDITKQYGTGGTTDIPHEMFRGGAKSVYVTRLGSDGEKAGIEIENVSGEKVIRLTMLYPGSRQFQLVIRDSIEDDMMKEFILVENTNIIQTIPFLKTDDDEVSSLIEAYAECGSGWFSLNKIGDGKGKIAVINQADITGGTNPTVKADDYSSAFDLLEPYNWNVMGLDTDDKGIQALLQAYIDRIYESGKLVMGVIGESTTVPFETRIKNARAFNDYKIVYVGSGFKDSTGKEYTSCFAAARVAGMIAGTPSNESITHTVITGATELTEILTNSQYIQAINNGMLTFSVSPQGMNWIESGVNTLVSPGSKEDLGWKKIKRTKIRFELMQRINDTVEMLIGNINNDPDGRAAIIQSAQGVCNTMVAEKKLLSGARAELDANNPPEGDSAWFVVYADDTDALEKMYFTFKFRFAPQE